MKSPSYHAFLLVDGYNIIGSWSVLKGVRDRHGFEPAREELIKTLTNYSAYRGLKTEIVFDAYRQKTPAYKEKYTPYLSVYFTNFAQTADSYIEKYCANFLYQKEAVTKRLIVATSDETQKRMVLGYGAEWISAPTLNVEVDSTNRCLKCQNSKNRRKPSKRFLFNSLDKKAQEGLLQLRNGYK